MLLNTHTWLLKEYAGERLGRDNLDILVYNVMPDILPIHRDITPEMTHRLERFREVPDLYGKARYLQFHLLVDDISHHGHITPRGRDRGENSTGGYAFRKGAPLVRAMMDLSGDRHESLSEEEALYRAHLIIEMAVDLVVYKRYPDIVSLFSDAVEMTIEERNRELVDSIQWAYSIPDALAREAVTQGMSAYRNEILKRSVSLEGRTDLFLYKFYGGEQGDGLRVAIQELLQRGIESVADLEEFLSTTLREISGSGFDGKL